jgi:very-short-patch-repair endonuclease
MCDIGYIEKKIRKPLSDEHKEKISKSRIKYLMENPDKVPYKLNHSSKESYPEKYFTQLFENENVKVVKHYRIGLYELDFCILDKKIDIEIDGEQHYSDKRILESDKRRTLFLQNDGWDVIRVRWSHYLRLSEADKISYIESLKLYINELIEVKPSFDLFEMKKRSKKSKMDLCICGNDKYIQAKLCIKCSRINSRKVERPPYEILLVDIENIGYKATGRKYGVSDNAVRKWMKIQI